MANSEYLFKKAKIEAMSLASDLIRDNGFLLVDSTYRKTMMKMMKK